MDGDKVILDVQFKIKLNLKPVSTFKFSTWLEY